MPMHLKVTLSISLTYPGNLVVSNYFILLRERDRDREREREVLKVKCLVQDKPAIEHKDRIQESCALARRASCPTQTQ